MIDGVAGYTVEKNLHSLSAPCTLSLCQIYLRVTTLEAVLLCDFCLSLSFLLCLEELLLNQTKYEKVIKKVVYVLHAQDTIFNY